MSYATPATFTRDCGWAETTALLRDEDRLLTEQLIRDAVAGVWTGTPTTDEQASALAALARLERQLATASSLMDGYMRAVVALPLQADAATLGVLESCCTALTRYALADDADNMTDRIEAGYERSIAWLRDVRAGKAQLVLVESGQPVGTSTARVRFGRARSAFNTPGDGCGSW